MNRERLRFLAKVNALSYVERVLGLISVLSDTLRHRRLLSMTEEQLAYLNYKEAISIAMRFYTVRC